MASFSEAEAYERNSSEQMKIGLGLIQRIAPRKGWKVLDLGCGTGTLTQILANFVGPEGKVIAIDPDSDRLKIARETHGSENIFYREGVAEILPEEDFNLIYSNFVLHWVKNKELVFQQASNVLKKDGVFALVASTEFDMETAYFPPSEHLVSDEYKEFILSKSHFLDVSDLHRYASTYRFDIDYLHMDKVSFTFDEVDGLIEFYMTHGTGNDYTASHFNADAMKKFYKGKFVNSLPIAITILRKL